MYGFMYTDAHTHVARERERGGEKNKEWEIGRRRKSRRGEILGIEKQKTEIKKRQQV